MSWFIPQAHAQAAGATSSQGDIFPLIMIVGMFVMLYFLTIRPQRKRQKEHAELIANLAAGDEVVTTSGIMGKIGKLDDDYVVLKVADNVELKFQKVAVHAVLPKGTLKKI
jgi:preprotein translocase subunit YajC